MALGASTESIGGNKPGKNLTIHPIPRGLESALTGVVLSRAFKQSVIRNLQPDRLFRHHNARLFLLSGINGDAPTLGSLSAAAFWMV